MERKFVLKADFYGYYLALHARASGVWHWLRGHDLRWEYRTSEEDKEVCAGDILCEGCPDASPGSTGIGIWCRAHDPWVKIVDR